MVRSQEQERLIMEARKDAFKQALEQFKRESALMKAKDARE